jgi:hypothetical protein
VHPTSRDISIILWVCFWIFIGLDVHPNTPSPSQSETTLGQHLQMAIKKERKKETHAASRVAFVLPLQFRAWQ